MEFVKCKDCGYCSEKDRFPYGVCVAPSALSSEFNLSEEERAISHLFYEHPCACDEFKPIAEDNNTK